MSGSAFKQTIARVLRREGGGNRDYGSVDLIAYSQRLENLTSSGILSRPQGNFGVVVAREFTLGVIRQAESSLFRIILTISTNIVAKLTDIVSAEEVQKQGEEREIFEKTGSCCKDYEMVFSRMNTLEDRFLEAEEELREMEEVLVKKKEALGKREECR
ncbi:4758_t:CDS:2 [Paraglomus brasilianum]|uniref:4758_t:CDS:1 n=1 Tax=Paraglomus brasilianum TaxID=144538 RepID=A0A9N8WCZ4_9GLOM|nr:4758_t:CDS:2 [Paraglomus brasilianum]